MQEVGDSLASIEQELAAVKSETNDSFSRVSTDVDNTETVLMARIDDLGDKLRLGMNKLQAAVGETARGGPDGELSISLEEAEALRQEEMEGVRERFSKTVAELNDQIGELKNDVRRQDEIIESKLKTHEQASEEASTILGDKLQQKMDSVTFGQERMKRQLKDLQEKVQGT